MSEQELVADIMPGLREEITFPCKVCGDKSSGVHYGVMSCEGCKGFYRRTIRQKMKYPACVFVGNCRLTRETRTRCQECRFKKCIESGMSKECIKYGRIPKKEKAKIIAERIATMQNSPTLSMENGYLEDRGRMSISRKHKMRTGSEPLCDKFFRMSPLTNEERRHSSDEAIIQTNSLFAMSSRKPDYLYGDVHKAESNSSSCSDDIQVHDIQVPSSQFLPANATMLPQRLSPVRFQHTNVPPLIGPFPLVCAANVPLATTLSYHYNSLLFNQFLNGRTDHPFHTLMRNHAWQSSLYANSNHGDKQEEETENEVIDLTVKRL